MIIIGITLVALVVTIVVLLILAGITLTFVLGDNSVFGKAAQAKEKTAIAKAREKLEMVLSSAQIEKHTNKQYDEVKYLNKYIKDQIKEAEIIGDVAIVDGYAFELDRSVPKIGKYVGKKDELVFPELETSVTIATDKKTGTISIKAKEATNGISKIEIIQEGHVLTTYECENSKEEIIKEYTAKHNGTYTVKVYAALTNSKNVEVEGLIANVVYSPNGSEIWKKEHSTKITVNETQEKVVSIKYQWTNTTVEPQESSFTDITRNNETITKGGVTGKYYLWTLLETESGEKRIERSESFWLDNTPPTVTPSALPESLTKILLSINASDEESGCVEKGKYKIDSNNWQDIDLTNEGSIVIEAETGEHDIHFTISDKAGNITTKTIPSRTKMHAWDTYNVLPSGLYLSKTDKRRHS